MKKIIVSFVVVIMASIFSCHLHAQENFILKIGTDKTFREFNYFDHWTINSGLAPLPPVEDLVVQHSGNQASLYVRATPGHEGALRAYLGVQFQWDLNGLPWEKVAPKFILITIDYSYSLECYWEQYTGSASCGVTFPFNPQGPWIEFLGDNEPPGLNKIPVTRAKIQYVHQVQQIENFERKIYVDFYAHGHSAVISTNYGLSSVTIHSIKVEFLPKKSRAPWLLPLLD